MDRVAKNEEFLRRLVKAKKREAVQLLKNSNDDEYKSVVEILLNSEGLINKAEAKKAKPVYSTLKKIKRISKKVFVRVFAKFFHQIIIILVFMLYRIFEQGISEVYCTP